MVEHTLQAKRRAWLARLEKAGAFAPAFELAELICAATGLDAAKQMAMPEYRLSAQAEQAAQALVQRREAGEPLQYILGEWEFYGLPFYVGEGVLIPRADTETLVDAAIEVCKRYGHAAPRMADLCSGSGCVAVALAKHIPGARVLAAELSEKACAYLARNLARNAAEQVTLLQCDVLQEHPALRELDLIVSNPPYIRADDMRLLAPEVRREPELALCGGPDGLRFYRKLSLLCRARLRPGGWLLFECAEDQAQAVMALLTENKYTQLFVRKDMEGRERVVGGRLAAPESTA